jgi:Diadenosine tetraphosphate (Ap4A) hydrolase and other HIT family hydrolases
MKFDSKCIFCRIADKQIPASILYEDNDVLVFLDTNPVSYGHCLVISKEHYDSFLSTPKYIMNKVMDVAQRIGQVEMRSLGAKGINIITNCYEAAGQSVKHFHVHVIPRYDAPDGLKLEMNKYGDVNLPTLREKICEALK